MVVFEEERYDEGTMTQRFSAPVNVGLLGPRLGTPVESAWPRQSKKANYRYSGLGRHMADDGDYRYSGLGRASYRYSGLGTVPTTTQPLQISPSMLTRFNIPSSVMGPIRIVQGIFGLLAAIANGVISQLHDIDANTRSTATKIVNWINQAVQGQPLSAVTFSPGEVNSMLDYCTNVKPIIEAAVHTAIQAGVALASSQSDSAGIISALGTVEQILVGGPMGGGGVANFVCTLPQVQQAIAAAQAAAAAPAMQTCPDGSQIPADQTCPAPRSYNYIPGYILRRPILTTTGSGGGSGGGGSTSGGMSGGMVIGIIAVLGIGAYAYSQSK